MKKHVMLFMSLAVLGLGGCASLSGVGGSDRYGCSMPEGSTCKPMTQVYQDTLYGVPAGPAGNQAAEASGSPKTAAAAVMPPANPASANALLSGPRVMRIYIAPWSDSEDNLLDGRRVYVKIDQGRWNLDHIKAALSVQYGPIKPAVTPPAPPAEASAKAPVQPASFEEAEPEAVNESSDDNIFKLLGGFQ